MARKLHSGVTDQTKAARHRLDDARALLRQSRWRGSMYLAGYAVECLLKAKLMRMYGCRNLSDLEEKLGGGAGVFTHQLNPLLELTGARHRMRQASGTWPHFLLVNRWVPAWRYSPDLSEQGDASAFLRAVEAVVHWLEVNA